MSVSTVSLFRFNAVCFLASGVPFGVAMGLMRASATYGAVTGAVSGTLMTLAMGGFHFGLARVGARVAAVHQTDRFVVTGPVGVVRAAAESALRELGVDRPLVEGAGDVVVLEGRTSITWKSWGETVRVELGPCAGGATPVHVTSRPSLRTTVADYGRNLANVRAIRAAMGA